MKLHLRRRYDREAPEDRFEIVVADETPGEDWLTSGASREAVAWYQTQVESGSDALAMARELIGMTFLDSMERGEDESCGLAGHMMAGMVRTATAPAALSPDATREQHQRAVDGEEE